MWLQNKLFICKWFLFCKLYVCMQIKMSLFDVGEKRTGPQVLLHLIFWQITGVQTLNMLTGHIWQKENATSVRTLDIVNRSYFDKRYGLGLVVISWHWIWPVSWMKLTPYSRRIEMFPFRSLRFSEHVGLWIWAQAIFWQRRQLV